MRARRFGLAVLLPIASLAGCSLATTVNENTDAIGRTNDTVAANTAAVKEDDAGDLAATSHLLLVAEAVARR